jgi:hypothetical protein
MSEGKFQELIQKKRVFLVQTKKDYEAGGNDMLDDMQTTLSEAKEEILHRLEVASCIKEDEGEKAYQKECLTIFNQWLEKWFGAP